MSGNELLVRMTMEDTNGTNIPVYPETKKDQLVDASSIIKLLLGAATTKAAREAIGAVADSELSSGDATTFAKSVINSIGEETLAALGVRYSITTNGYICFGDLFGGLILQWAYPEQNYYITGNLTNVDVVLPISYTDADYYGLCSFIGDVNTSSHPQLAIKSLYTNKVTLAAAYGVYLVPYLGANLTSTANTNGTVILTWGK